MSYLNVFKSDLLAHLGVNGEFDFVPFTEGIRDINEERCIIVQVN